MRDHGGFITVTCSETVWLQCHSAYNKENIADTNTYSAQAMGQSQWLQNPLERQVCAPAFFCCADCLSITFSATATSIKTNYQDDG